MQAFAPAQALTGKVAIVTGAARGIGRALAWGLARAGARVALADVDEAGVRTVARALEEEVGAGQAIGLRVDVSDPDSVDGMARSVAERLGGIDVLVNNAALWGTLQRRPFWEIPLDEWDRVMAVNTRGPFLCSRAVLPYMRERGKGKIILIGSTTVWSA